MPIFYIKLLKAKNIKIRHPKVPKIFEGSFFKKFPPQKPLNDIINEPKPIIIAAFTIGVSVN